MDVVRIGDGLDFLAHLEESIVNGELKMNTTVFTAKRDNSGYLYAHVLEVTVTQPIEVYDGGFENVKELKERMYGKYGQDAVFMSSRQFAEELASRQIHTPELVALLWENGESLGIDQITRYVVYGSPNRPMNSIWARIDNAVFIPADKQSTGYHTYVAVPSHLDKEIVEKYELVFVSRPE